METTRKREKKSGEGLLLGQNSPFNSIPLLGTIPLKPTFSGSEPPLVVKPKFKDIPLSNLDLIERVKFLEIPIFKGVFSRDLEDQLHRTGSCIRNLNDSVGNGTHWVATFVKGKFIFCFDSFSLPPRKEFVEYAKRIGKDYIYNSGYPIQNMASVRCEYYCLYFLNEIHRKSFYDVLKVFSLSDSRKNENFVKKKTHSSWV